jgi:tetratricopeptide (TPR) repeat protein
MMARISNIAVIALTTGGGGALGAFALAQQSYEPKSPPPGALDVLQWLLSGQDWVALTTLVLGVISTAYAIYEIFQPEPPTEGKITTIVEGAIGATNSLINDVSGQIFLADEASTKAHQTTHTLLTADLHEKVAVAVDQNLLTPEQIAAIRASVAIAVSAAGAAAGFTPFFPSGRTALFWVMIERSRREAVSGNLANARRAAELSLQHCRGDRERSVAESELGNIALAGGELAVARTHFQSALEACERRSTQNPGNAALPRDLSVSYNKIGDVAMAAGDLDGARTAYGVGLAIVDRLLPQDPGDTEWQRDLSVNHDRIGDVAVAAGDLAGARLSYQAGLAIRQRLSAHDSGNTEWQRDLSVSHIKIGDVAVAAGDLAGARLSYQAGLAISERLSAQDSGNTAWQRDLSVSREKMGDVAEKAGDLPAAVKHYQASLPIAQRLADMWPDHPGFSNDLAITRRRLAALQARLAGA